MDNLWVFASMDGFVPVHQILNFSVAEDANWMEIDLVEARDVEVIVDAPDDWSRDSAIVRVSWETPGAGRETWNYAVHDGSAIVHVPDDAVCDVNVSIPGKGYGVRRVALHETEVRVTCARVEE